VTKINPDTTTEQLAAILCINYFYTITIVRSQENDKVK